MISVPLEKGVVVAAVAATAAAARGRRREGGRLTGRRERGGEGKEMAIPLVVFSPFPSLVPPTHRTKAVAGLEECRGKEGKEGVCESAGP